MTRPAAFPAAGLTFLAATIILVPATVVGQSYRSVTDARLVSPEPENWLSYRGNYNEWGYSPLDQIDASNVQNLTPVWAFSTNTTGGHESAPVVNDGVMLRAGGRRLNRGYRGYVRSATETRRGLLRRGPVRGVGRQRARDERVGRLKRGQDRSPFDSVVGRGGTRQGDPAAADYRLHQHHDDIMLRSAEAARSHESEHHAQPVVAPASKKFLDHVESGTCRHLHGILLRSGRFALGTDGAVVVG